LSIQALQAEIDRKAEQEATSIRETAQAEAQKILAEARAKAANLRDEQMKALQRELDAREKAELAVARMSQKGDLLRVKSKWTTRVTEETEKRITKMTESGAREYQELLANLIIDAVTKLSGSKFIVETNSRDKDAVNKLVGMITERATKIKNEKITIQLRTLQTSTLGGAVVSTEDGVQCFNNTLEARLSAASKRLEGTIGQILFPNGGNE